MFRIFAFCAALLMLAACTPTERGAAGGAVAGGVIGAAVTGNVRGAAVGAVIGGVTGAVIGRVSEDRYGRDQCRYRGRDGRTYIDDCPNDY